MIVAGRLIIGNAIRSGSIDPSWHGCIDHLLELVTEIAFDDIPESAGALLAARKLIGHFSSSSQAQSKLLSLQRGAPRFQ
jgi:hypothetical protein